MTLFDFGQTSDYYYFIMEYVDGANLRQLIDAKNLQPREALDLVGQICSALQFAHDENCSSRYQTGKYPHHQARPGGRSRTLDWPSCWASNPSTGLTASQMTMGTPNYMAD